MVPSHKYALLAVMGSLVAGPVFAVSKADLQQQIKQQERQMKRLERRLKGTRGAVKQNRNLISEMTERFRINGFFSGGVAVNDGDAVTLPLYQIGDDYTTDAVTRMGLQMTFQVIDDVSLISQLVSRGTDAFDTKAEWAYLNWNATNNLTVRVGRQRTPYYLLSEYLDVGFAYPWVRPPTSMYNIPVSTTDGVGMIYDLASGSVNFSTQFYAGAGSSFSDQLQGDFKQNQAWGLSQFVEWKNFTFRVGYNTSNVQVSGIVSGGRGGNIVDGVAAASTLLGSQSAAVSQLLGGAPPALSPLRLDNIKTEYFSAAASYDNGKLLVMAEISNLKVKDFILPVGDGGYLTVGYRFGKWMPHFTVGKFYTDSDSDKQMRKLLNAIDYAARSAATQLANAPAATPELDKAKLSALKEKMPQLYNQVSNGLIHQETAYTLGLTYNLNSRVKAKLEATHFENFGDARQLTLTEQTLPLPGGPKRAVSNYSKVSGNGRFNGAPGALDGHAAIYSFSIDAVF